MDIQSDITAHFEVPKANHNLALMARLRTFFKNCQENVMGEDSVEKFTITAEEVVRDKIRIMVKASIEIVHYIAYHIHLYDLDKFDELPITKKEETLARFAIFMHQRENEPIIEYPLTGRDSDEYQRWIDSLFIDGGDGDVF